MKKKMILNLAMGLTILVVAVCGVMAVGSVKGWFDTIGEESAFAVAETTGIAMIERNGIAYEVKEGTVIREGDILYTKTAASLRIADAGQSRINLNGNAKIEMSEVSKTLQVIVHKGDALVDGRGSEGITAVTGEVKATLDQAVVSVSSQAGASMVYVYAGVTSLLVSEKEVTAKAGEVITIAGNQENPEVTTLTAASLSDEQMRKLIESGMDETFCFTKDDLEQVQKEREAEKQRAQQELLAQQEEEKKAEREKAKKTSDSTSKMSAQEMTGESADGVAEEEPEEEPEEVTLTCTIEIRCDTILSNMDNLEAGKEGYVPESGTILGTTAVTFEEGETVFDVLARVCEKVGIQLEYSWTPMYDSYYIEGIHHLYEFDCGSESGWMYKVNGWFPNYGCSSYNLQDGDTIVWCYTCKGLGADVGGPVY